MRTKSLSMIEVEYAAYKLAVKFMTWNEPIPPFGSRFPNILESCINSPFMTFQTPKKGFRDFYRGIVGKASMLFYLMIKNHPFQNGNKRIAIMTLFLFLDKNGKWLNMSNDRLYKVALGVARSKPKSKDKIIAWLEDVFSKHLI